MTDSQNEAEPTIAQDLPKNKKRAPARKSGRAAKTETTEPAAPAAEINAQQPPRQAAANRKLKAEGGDASVPGGAAPDAPGAEDAREEKGEPARKSRRGRRGGRSRGKGRSAEAAAHGAPEENARPGAPDLDDSGAAPAHKTAPTSPETASAESPAPAEPKKSRSRSSAKKKSQSAAGRKTADIQDAQAAPVQADALADAGEGDSARQSEIWGAHLESSVMWEGGAGFAMSEDMASAAPYETDDAEAAYGDESEDEQAQAPRPEQKSGARGAKGKKASASRQTDGKTHEAREGRLPSVKAPAVKAKVQAMAARRKMFISVVPGEQVEVVLAEDGQIHEYYLEMSHQAKFKGNIYKGVIHNIDANLQAAFVNYGANKNGFLQIDEVHPEYYLTTHEPAKGKKYPPIQKVLKAGQEVLVQVVKEPAGSKGAFLTTWLSLAGRFLVLTPGQEQIGISRKVDNDEERGRLRELINGLDPGSGLGVIVRTVSAGTSKTTLKNDLMYLKRLWKDIRKRGTTESAPAMIHEEPGLAARAVRDYLTDDVQEIWVDDEAVAASVRDMAGLLFPRKSNLVKVHSEEKQGMWERFNLQRQLEQIYAREVTLPSGGRLVFDQTEALMAIDINSGKISGKGNFEAMAFKTNLEAAQTIPRQLKLRDIGGQIVIDFIELRDKNNIREVEKALRNAMKNDRARNDVGRMSSFGLLEMVRQRTGSSALAITMETCPCCKGTGLRRNLEWQSLQILREINFKARNFGGELFVYETSAELGMYLLNQKRERLRDMEQQLGKRIELRIK